MAKYIEIRDEWIQFTIDLIHCKECKYYTTFENDDGEIVKHCRNESACVRPEEDGFCNFAERKENNTLDD